MKKNTKNIIYASIIGVSVVSMIFAGTIIKGDTEEIDPNADLDNVLVFGLYADETEDINSLENPISYDIFSNTVDSNYTADEEFVDEEFSADERYYKGLVDDFKNHKNKRYVYPTVAIATPLNQQNITHINNTGYIVPLIPKNDTVPDLNINFYRTDNGLVTYKLDNNTDDIETTDSELFINKPVSRFGQPSDFIEGQYFSFVDRNIEEIPENINSTIVTNSSENADFSGILKNGYPAKYGSDYDISDKDLEWATAVAILIKNGSLNYDTLVNNYTINQDSYNSDKLLDVIEFLVNIPTEESYMDISLSDNMSEEYFSTDLCHIDSNYDYLEVSVYYPDTSVIDLFNVDIPNKDSIKYSPNTYFFQDNADFVITAVPYKISAGDKSARKVSLYKEDDNYQVIASGTRYSNKIYSSETNDFIIVQPESDVKIEDIPFYENILPVTYNAEINVNADNLPLDNVVVTLCNKVENENNNYYPTLKAKLIDNVLHIKNFNAGQYALDIETPIYQVDENGKYWWYNTSVDNTEFEIKDVSAVDVKETDYISTQIFDINLEHTNTTLKFVDEQNAPIKNKDFIITTLSNDKTDKYSEVNKFTTNENGEITLEGFNPQTTIYILQNYTASTKLIISKLDKNQLENEENLIQYASDAEYSYITVE